MREGQFFTIALGPRRLSRFPTKAIRDDSRRPPGGPGCRKRSCQVGGMGCFTGADSPQLCDPCGASACGPGRSGWLRCRLPGECSCGLTHGRACPRGLPPGGSGGRLCLASGGLPPERYDIKFTDHHKEHKAHKGRTKTLRRISS
jgi:hypothetical protein